MCCYPLCSGPCPPISTHIHVFSDAKLHTWTNLSDVLIQSQNQTHSHRVFYIYTTLIETHKQRKCVVLISLWNPACDFWQKITEQCLPPVQSEQSREGPGLAYYWLVSPMKLRCETITAQNTNMVENVALSVCVCMCVVRCRRQCVCVDNSLI